MATQMKAPAGSARCQAESIQDLLDQEIVPVPRILREVAYTFNGSQPIAAKRYYDPEFHRKEVEAVWKHVWQLACLEQDIPNVGDTVIYDIASLSIVVARSAPNEIRAFHNVCRHRGRRLLSEANNVEAFSCPYHNFTWRLDGRFLGMPCAWDFPHVNMTDFGLHPVQVARWQGFVFINIDPDASSFDDFAGPLKSHLARYDLANKWKVAHVGKIMGANWKITMEAFMEAYHAFATHPQAATSTGDANTQIDIWHNEHFSRLYTAQARPSPHLKRQITEQDIAFDMLGDGTNMFEAARANIRVPEGMSARRYIAGIKRQEILDANGVDLSKMTDSEMVDAIQYYLFPNFFPWAAPNPNIVYRFRPYGNDPEKSMMETMLLTYPPKDQPVPPSATMRVLAENDSWLDAADSIGGLGQVFAQDEANIVEVQKGVKASIDGEINLGNYQEARIREVHRLIDQYIAKYSSQPM